MSSPAGRWRSIGGPGTTTRPASLAHPEIFQQGDNLERFQSFDFSRYA